MPRPGITKEQVWEAAETLEHEGANPTVLRIRAKIGGGSPNRIAPFLAQWKQQRTPPAEGAPEPPVTVATAMDRIWKTAWEEAQALFQSERDALAADRGALEHERAEVRSEVERLDGVIEEIQSELKGAREALRVEQKSHSETQAELHKIRGESNERTLRIQELQKEFHQLRKAGQEATARAERLGAEASHLTEQRDSAERHARELKEINKVSGQKVHRLEQELSEGRTRIDELTTGLLTITKGDSKR